MYTKSGKLQLPYSELSEKVNAAKARWEVSKKKLIHRDIISRSETSLKFLMKSAYDLLPTPTNKQEHVVRH